MAMFRGEQDCVPPHSRSMLRCAAEARACHRSPTLRRRACVTVPSRNPPAATQAKEERMAASGGWRWALVHARGMARDIGLVLRIRSFQILILQVLSRGVARRLYEVAVFGAVLTSDSSTPAHFVHNHVLCQLPLPATAQGGIPIASSRERVPGENCDDRVQHVCGWQTCLVKCMLEAISDGAPVH
jgi:hypothetical protein